jgi:hypothetical protein
MFSFSPTRFSLRFRFNQIFRRTCFGMISEESDVVAVARGVDEKLTGKG